MTEAKWALDKSQLDRSLLGDLAALLAVAAYLPDERLEKPFVVAELEALVKELWPTGSKTP